VRLLTNETSTCYSGANNRSSERIRPVTIVNVQDEIERCRREIAAIETSLLAGHPDIAGLWLALSDWSAELGILEAELATQTGSATNEKSRQPGGRRLETGADLFPEPVDPVPGVGLRTLDLEAHLLAQGSAQKPADGMCLPTRGFHELGECSAFLPPEQGQDLGFLATLAWRTGFCHPGWLGFLLRPGFGFAALGGCLARGRALPAGGSILRGGPLRRGVGALFRNRGGCVGFCVGHVVNTLSALGSRMTIHHSVRPESQVKYATHEHFLARLRNRRLFAKLAVLVGANDIVPLRARSVMKEATGPVRPASAKRTLRQIPPTTKFFAEVEA
jgi:hypothetical protein